MKLDINILNSYVEKGLLRNQSHPTLPLLIWNYTETVQFEQKWDDLLLKCRGLITDTNGNVVAKTWDKFFNDSENRHIPTDKFVIEEKLDGSMLILFYYNNQWITATKGSFTSEQAIKGYEILLKNHPKFMEGICVDYTFIFEVLYSQNRIVVSYGNTEKVVLTGVVDTKTGEEIDSHLFKDRFEVVKRYDFKEYQTIKSLNWENAEGFVVKFSNGSKCKIKFETYLYLHRIVTNTSSRTVWEYLKDNKSFKDLIEKTPDEFHAFVSDTISDLLSKYEDIEVSAKYFVIDNYKLSQKDFALKVIAFDKKLSSVCFSMRNDINNYLYSWIPFGIKKYFYFKFKKNKSYRDIIFKQIEPAYEKAFSI